MAIKKAAVANTYGVAQTVNGKWFSVSEEAFSSGACMFDTCEEAERQDAQHHAFMMKHHSAAKGRAPFIERG
jgi:hypothetical protein